MKVKILLSFIIFISVALHAQVNVIDSLQNELKTVKDNTDKAKLLNAISNQYKYSDPSKMTEYGNKALLLAQQNNNKIEAGNAYLNIGTSYIILGDYKKAIDHFILAKAIFEDDQLSQINTLETIEGLAQTYGSMGIVFSEQSNYAKALEFYLKSVKLYEGLNNEIKCSRLYNNIGVVYKSEASFNKALEYFEKARSIQEKLKDPNMGITLTNIANIHRNANDLDKAFQYYTLAKNHLHVYPNPRALGELYNNLGLYYKAKKQPENAINHWEKAIATFESFEDKFGMSDSYLYLGQLYLEQNKLPQAMQMANEALRLATAIKVLETKAVSQKLISDIYSKQGNNNLALKHYQNYSITKDSLINAENIRKAVEASLKYEFEKKELLQQEENEKRELLLKEEAKGSRMKLIFGVLIALLLFGIGFLIYNRMQLKKNLTLQKELAEYEQKALHLQMNPHFVFNCLGSISSFIVQNGTDSAIKYLSKFSKLMRLTLEYSKESLIPIDKEIESLQNYLELEQLRFNHNFKFVITKDKNIEDDVAIPPLLIQPFVENAIIHGVIPKREMGDISIDFLLQGEVLICTILDNGIGINKSKQNKENSVVAHKSMALDIITKRLEMMRATTSKKATILVEELTENNQITGTKVVLNLPLQYLEIE